MAGSGPVKLKITKQADYTYSSAVGEPFEVLINPEEYELKTKLQWASGRPLGSRDTEARFQSIDAEELNLTFHFDGTGVISTAPQSLKGKSVSEQISAFKETVTKYDMDKHTVLPLKLEWGDFTFKGVLAELSVKYKLFDVDGNPLRATATATFRTASKDLEKEIQQNSPDVTHVKTLKAGDTLPSLCDGVYNGSNYFVQVAEANELNRLRSLKVGTELMFPPLKEN